MSEIRAKSEIKLNNGITWTFVKGNKLDYVINILSGGEYQQLKASNKELKARIARLLTHAEHAVERLRNDSNPYADVLGRIVKQTDKESIAHIQAEAVEKFAEYFWPKNAIYTALKAGEAGYQKQQAIKYAQQLREADK